jgi:hypothetical protein
MQDNDNPNLTPVAVEPEPALASSGRAGIWNALSWVRDLAFSVLIAVVLIVFISLSRWKAPA